MNKKKKSVWNKLFVVIILFTLVGVAFVGITDNQKYSITGKGNLLSDVEKASNKKYYEETGNKIDKVVKDIIKANTDIDSFVSETKVRDNEREFTRAFDIITDYTKTSKIEFNKTEDKVEYHNFTDHVDHFKESASITMDQYQFIDDKGLNEYILESGFDKYVLFEDKEDVVPELMTTELSLVNVVLSNTGKNAYVESFDDNTLELGVLLTGDDLTQFMEIYSVSNYMEETVKEDKVYVNKNNLKATYKIIVNTETLLVESVQIDMTDVMKGIAEQINNNYEEPRFQVDEYVIDIQFKDHGVAQVIKLPEGVEDNTITPDEYFDIKKEIQSQED